VARAKCGRVEAAAKPKRVAADFPARGAVLIGVSTGGPRTLDDILPPLPEDFPWPIVVAQHMPATFTGTFAAGLNKRCALTVTEVSAATPLRAGHVYIGRGGADVVIESRLGRAVANSVPAKPDYPWHPSVERLVTSAMEAMEPSALVGVQLTGMGDDGAKAMTSLLRAGGRTIAEDASTAIVFGMPGELIRMGGAGRVLPCDRIAAQLSAWIQ
jgi:two-component system chemotaxis response regulator CheB